MGAFNWIDFEAKCPNCHQIARICAQTHIASDYGGDRTGIFHGRHYRLGDKMAWWPEPQPFHDWREEWKGDSDDLPLDQAIEACCADCQNCRAEICAVIRFENLRPVEVTQISLESDWPEGLSA